MRNTDPNGNWVETLWDVTQVGMGAVSLWNNAREGSVGAAIIDGAGMVLDVGAAVLPLVPAGASTAIEAARAGDFVGKVARWGDDLIDPVKVGVRELGARASGRASQAWGAVKGVFRRGGDDAVEIATERSAPSVAREGATTVYRSVNEAGQVQYVGITNNLARRAAEHLRERGMGLWSSVVYDRSRSGLLHHAVDELHALDDFAQELVTVELPPPPLSTAT